MTGQTVTNSPPSPERSAWRIDDIAASLGVSRRTIERFRASGRFPKPDATLNRMPVWFPSTVRSWIERGGAVADRGR